MEKLKYPKVRYRRPTITISYKERAFIKKMIKETCSSEYQQTLSSGQRTLLWGLAYKVGMFVG